MLDAIFSATSIEFEYIYHTRKGRNMLMAKTLQLNMADRIGDALFIALLRAGLKIGTMSLLTVRGRTGGQPHTIPVLLAEQDGERSMKEAE